MVTVSPPGPWGTERLGLEGPVSPWRGGCHGLDCYSLFLSFIPGVLAEASPAPGTEGFRAWNSCLSRGTPLREEGEQGQGLGKRPHVRLKSLFRCRAEPPIRPASPEVLADGLCHQAIPYLLMSGPPGVMEIHCMGRWQAWYPMEGAPAGYSAVLSASLSRVAVRLAGADGCVQSSRILPGLL